MENFTGRYISSVEAALPRNPVFLSCRWFFFLCFYASLTDADVWSASRRNLNETKYEEALPLNPLRRFLFMRWNIDIPVLSCVVLINIYKITMKDTIRRDLINFLVLLFWTVRSTGELRKPWPGEQRTTVAGRLSRPFKPISMLSTLFTAHYRDDSALWTAFWTCSAPTAIRFVPASSDIDFLLICLFFAVVHNREVH